MTVLQPAQGMTAGVLAEILRLLPAETALDLAPIGDQEAWDTEDSPPEPIVGVQLTDDRLSLIGGGW